MISGVVLIFLQVGLVSNEAILYLREGESQRVQVSAADADGLRVQQGLSIQNVDWDQILRVEGLSESSPILGAINTWLPQSELLWRFRSRIERRDFQGAARLVSELVEWQDHPSRVGMLIREGQLQIALAQGDLASAVPHLLALGDRLVVDVSKGGGASRLDTPVNPEVRLHPHFPPIVPPGPGVASARRALADLPPPVDPLSVWLRQAWDVVLQRAEGVSASLPDWRGSTPAPPAVRAFRACELGMNAPLNYESWHQFADRSPSRRAVLARIQLLSEGAPSPMADLAGWQAVEMLKAMSLPTEANRLHDHLRLVNADGVLSSPSEGSS
ncbi:MAG: hypothetical protein CMJ28_04620 [Phycisphaerae bacterium]|nr:hypothetical protein [Phycisphaerae bacterium]